jgi:hypothetical protein
LGTLSSALLLAVCAALILAACGGDDGDKSSASAGVSPSGSTSASVSPSQSASTASPISTPTGTGGGDLPCILITKQEAEQALGEPLGEPTSGALAGTISCGFQPSPDRGVLISITKGASKEDFEANVKQGAELLHAQAQPVPGVGDEAFWLEPYLIVLKSDVFFRISVWSPQISAPDQLERAKGLAIKAAARIP